MNEIVTITGMSNREFLETHALPGRVGLSGGITLIDKAIARAERHIDQEGRWSLWSHAFLFQGRDCASVMSIVRVEERDDHARVQNDYRHSERRSCKYPSP